MESNLTCVTLEAGQDLSAKQYLFVTVASDGQVDPTGDGAVADGVLQNNPDAAGKAAAVAISGVSKVVAGGTFDAGTLVCSSAAGKAVAATTGKQVLGRALAAGADGKIIPILLKFSGEARVPAG